MTTPERWRVLFDLTRAAMRLAGGEPSDEAVVAYALSSLRAGLTEQGADPAVIDRRVVAADAGLRAILRERQANRPGHGRWLQ